MIARMTAAKLRALRKRLEMSQAELAKAIGYKDRRTLAKMEQGARQVSEAVELRVSRLVKELP